MINKDGKENFSKIISEISLKTTSKTHIPIYYIFDIIPLPLFETPNHPKNILFNSRQDILKKLFKNIKYKSLKLSDQIKWTPENFKMMKHKCKKFKWEGLILRRNALYKGYRSNDILKIKEMFSDEFKVIGLKFSKKQILESQELKEVDILGSILIKVDNNKVYVGSGFTDEQRIYYFKNPDKILGKIVEVQYFERTNVSLRHPVIKHIYESGRRT
jgi:DNA ligase-1